MSQLLKSDIKNQEHIVRLAKDLKDIEPFAEFDNNPFADNDYSSLHLGECPNLELTVPKKNIKKCFTAIFRIARPNIGKPFIQYFVEKTPYNTYSFPLISPELIDTHDETCIILDNILNSTCNSLIKIGYFPYNQEGYYYSFYEAREDDLIYGSNDLIENTHYIWLTPKEIIEKEFLSRKIENIVYDFVAFYSEGACRLYNKGEFITSPDIYYVGGNDDLIELVITRKYSEDDKSKLFIGDAIIGIISTFFNINSVNNKLRISNKMKNGSLIRIAHWSNKPIAKKVYLIKNNSGDRNAATTTTTVTDNTTISNDTNYTNDVDSDYINSIEYNLNKNNNLTFYNIDIDNCEILSKHSGIIISRGNSFDVDASMFIDILKNKTSNLFIFE